MRGLEGKRVLVTGAAAGIGLAIAERLADEGAAVIATDVGPGAWLAAEKTECPRMPLDVANEENWRHVVATVKSRWGGLDILVNNAGIAGPSHLEDEDETTWQSIQDVDQKGVWLGMKHAGRLIADSGGGSIVNVGSIFGVVGGFGTHFAYHAAKGAVGVMTKNAALHFAESGVRVNAVLPGFIDTEASRGWASRRDLRARMVDGAPMKRMGTPEEVASAVAFLASGDASFLTGSELCVDGGWTAH